MNLTFLLTIDYENIYFNKITFNVDDDDFFLFLKFWWNETM